MRFKKYYSSNNIDFDMMNRAMLEELRDNSCCKRDKRGINEFLLLTNEELEERGFFEKYPHLK